LDGPDAPINLSAVVFSDGILGTRDVDRPQVDPLFVTKIVKDLILPDGVAGCYKSLGETNPSDDVTLIATGVGENRENAVWGPISRMMNLVGRNIINIRMDSAKLVLPEC
jgi:hypothetical protein